MNEKTLKDLLSSLKTAGKPKTSAYDTTATVTRVENGTAWVHIPGGVTETPVKLTISAKAGDTVQVRVSGGRAFMVGNASAPPTDDTVATGAVRQISTVRKVVERVREVAETASRIAGNTNQYFWHTQEGTDTGAHITEIPQEEFLADPANGGGNLLARSNGIAVRNGLSELSVIDDKGFATYAEDGTEIAHLGYDNGKNSTGGISKNPYATLGKRASNSVIGNYSTAEGNDITASGYASHAEGTRTTASGRASHAEGHSTSATGDTSTIDGAAQVAPSHAEGYQTNATSGAAHAEGQGTTASGNASHSEGYRTTASGDGAHAEGVWTGASGRASHASGNGTKASSDYQTAIGQYNVEDTNDEYALIIGNGTDDSNRSNAFAVRWDGSLVAGGVQSYTPTWESGQAPANSHCVVSAGLCSLFYQGSGGTHNNQTLLGTLPVGARPKSLVFCPCVKGANAYGMVQIDTDGKIYLGYISSASVTARLYFNCSFPVV